MLRSIAATTKIDGGCCDDVSPLDIEELFLALDTECSSVIHASKLTNYFRLVLDPPVTAERAQLLVNYIDEDGTGTISLEQLSAGFMNHAFLQQLSESRTPSESTSDDALDQAILDRRFFLERLAARVDRDDSFNTLPVSIISICVFIGLVVAHLDVHRRYQVSAGIEAWVKGYGSDLPGPYLQDHVADAGTAWTWLSGSGLLSVLGDCLETEGLGERCNVGPRNILIGGVYLNRVSQDGSKQLEWLLHSGSAQTHLTAHRGDYLGAARAQLQSLHDHGWVDVSMDEMRLGFMTFAEQEQTFSVTEVIVVLDSYGIVVSFVASSTFSMSTYPTKAMFFLDGAYVLLLLWMSFHELRDVINNILSMGFLDGIHVYLQISNMIDWLSIFCGVANCAIWISCCLSMSTPAIKELLVTKGAGGMTTLTPNVMDLDVKALMAIEKDLNETIGLFRALHIVMGVNTISIMVRFFKAFRANPRLAVVTNTLQGSATDIVHFCVVFVAVYIGFALVGHVLFGGDVIAFSSFGASLNTGFVVLMGEFSWYVEASRSKEPVASGIPFAALVAWFVFYMVFVLLILLNMLLAIILEQYAKLMELNDSPDSITLWRQCWMYVQRRRQTRHFIPDEELLRLMEDPSEPGHPQTRVTRESLLTAFPKMKTAQADFLIQWLVSCVEAESEVDVRNARLKDIEGLVEIVIDELKRVGLNVQDGSISMQTQRGRTKTRCPVVFAKAEPMDCKWPEAGEAPLQAHVSSSHRTPRETSPKEDACHASASPARSPLLSPQHQLCFPLDSPSTPLAHTPAASPRIAAPSRTTLSLPASALKGAPPESTELAVAHPPVAAGMSLPAEIANQLAELATLPGIVLDVKARASDLPDRVHDLCATVAVLTVRVEELILRHAAGESPSPQRARSASARELPSLCGIDQFGVHHDSPSS
eukprot:TRINITY_DN19511_c0_g2_i1.p1 TRINITY_DN19511_c0_g2~~TRINITY_DN19511_c0_g2_i1.p1  ORF type:complete len:968 (+),score=107.73 TRINITY_DN19511_c0_g2_i1:111-2906(+)